MFLRHAQPTVLYGLAVLLVCNARESGTQLLAGAALTDRRTLTARPARSDRQAESNRNPDVL
jgi:hypothetical protein